MQLMQYRITLPADYDMEIIRRRVATNGHRLDDFPGLGLKAYGIRQRGVAGAPVNSYAPFYLWTAPEAANRFLWGPFRNIVADFGRPAVEHWQGLAFTRGPAAGADPALPRTAVRRTETVPEGSEPAAVVEDAVARTLHRAGADGLQCAALGIDPRGWQLVHFSLWAGPPPEAEPGDRYEVLHLSTPAFPELPEGRHW